MALNLREEEASESCADPKKPSHHLIKAFLSHSLSLSCTITTTSLKMHQDRHTISNTAQQLYREVGRGSCGIVFQRPGCTYVAKRALSDDVTELWNDSQVHVALNDVLKAQYQVPYGLKVPKCLGFQGCTNETDRAFWHNEGAKFPHQWRSPGNLLISEYIHPLPAGIRTALIELYCKPELQDSAKTSPGNEHCLVRLYLGRRRRSSRPSTFFSLKNFKLYLDQMRDLELDLNTIAKEMAYGLATLHWKVGVDGRDVEFVLGSESCTALRLTPPSDKDLQALEPGKTTLPRSARLNSQNQGVSIWMLDFNQCRRIKPDPDGVEQCVDAFFINDPYFPRPCRDLEDDQVWTIFKLEYLKVSQHVAGPGQSPELAKEFINRVEVRACARAEVEP